MNQQTQEEAAYVADARARLQAEAAARREYDPQEAARVRSLMWDADQRIKMPRIAAEPTEIRRWAVERSARFGPVKPAERIERHMHTEALSVALSGRTPTAEQVALLAALASDTQEADDLLSSMALLTLPLPGDEPREIAMRHLIRTDLRPIDLETLVNAALMLEFAAAHVIGRKPMARLLAAASVLWWASGQRIAAGRALRLPIHYDMTGPITVTMSRVLRVRRRPDWLDA